MAVFPMVWGFTHEATPKPIINCRIETADQKALWKDSWFKRRCIIPASWYYEWGVPPSEVGFRNANEQRCIKKEKYVIQPEGANITYLAGLYRYEEHCGMQVPVFSVLTRESVAPVRTIHDRMPLILTKEEVRPWVRDEKAAARFPKQDEAIRKHLLELAKAEERKETDLDVVSGIFGELLAEIFAWKDDEWHEELHCFGFYLGKFIYLMDAYEDLPHDRKTHAYNPFEPLSRQKSPEEYETLCKCYMTSQISECARSFERLPVLQHAEIIRNILYSGVWSKYEILQKKKKKKK